MSQTFYTVICANTSDSLLKDMGMIPFLFGEKLGYDSHFVSFIPENTDDVCTRQVHSLKLISLLDDRNDKTRIPLFSKSMLHYIWENAKKMDILNLYFLKHSIFYAITYKLRNPKGFLYLKLDLNPERTFKNENSFSSTIKKWFLRQYLNHIPDLVSAESTLACNYVLKNLKIKSTKFIQIYNGIDDSLIERNHIMIKSFEEKENSIIVVGRIGSPEKNHELLLRAIPKINWGNWKIHFIGPITPSFQSQIESFFAQYPEQKENVIFEGPIYDKLKLWEYYNNAKIFCLTSLYEGFSLVLPEAACFGNYIISTPVPPINDFILDGELGQLVDKTDEDDIAQKINHLITHQEILQSTYPQIIEHSQAFQWNNIIQKLYSKINEKKY